MNNITETTSTTGNLPQQSQSSYVRAVQAQPSNIFPKKEQAIVINVREDLKLADYIIAVGNIVQPRNIRFASRISHDRVCIYLSSVEHVKDIVENHEVIRVGAYNLTVRRLIAPARRIILSNVCPSIPHTVIEQSLKNIGIQPMSQISFLRATYINEEYSHIMSFRRQMYIKPDENLELPPSLLINYEDTAYRVFVCYDDITCFICKAKGHISKQCPETRNIEIAGTSDVGNKQSEQIESNSSVPIENNEVDSHKNTHVHDDESIDSVENMEALNNPLKRTATTIDNTSSENLIQLMEEASGGSQPGDEHFLTPKPKAKKSKNNTLPLEEVLQSTKTYFQECKSSFSFETFVDFLENAFGNPDPLSLARTLNLNVPELLQILNNIYPHILQRAIKNRCTRLCKKLKNESCDSDTDSSFTQ